MLGRERIVFDLLPLRGCRGDFQFRDGGSLAGVLFGFRGTPNDWTIGNLFHPATFGALECFDLCGVRDGERDLPAQSCVSVYLVDSSLASRLVLSLSVWGGVDGVLRSEIAPLDSASVTRVCV